MSIATEYLVPIQNVAQVGDIVVVGIFGPTVTTPTGWTVVAHTGACTLYSHTVVAGEAGTNVLFSFSAPKLAACFVLNVSGSTGVTGRIAVSPTAVSSLGLTVSNSTAPLIVAGCFSTLSQTFVPPTFAVNTTVNAAGIGTNCPSVVFGQTTANAVLTFGAGLVTNLFSFELDFAGTTPVIYGTASTSQGDVPPASIAFSQQTTMTATSGTSMNLPSLTLNLNDALVCCIEFTNKTQTTTVSDGNSGVWTEVTGCPARNTTANTTFDMWYSVAHPSGATVVKVTDSSTIVHLGANLSVYTGVATTSPIDTQNTDTTGNNTVDTAITGLVTPSSAASAIVGGTEVSGTFSSQTDYGTGGGTPTRLTQVVGGQVMDCGYQLGITPNGTLTYGIQNTYLTTQFWAGAVIALKAPAAVTAFPPPSLRHRQQPKRVPHVKAKRPVKNSIELRIPQAPPAIFPPELRHRQQPKRIPHVKAKRPLKNSVELRIPQAPPAIFPPELRHKQQLKRIPHVRPKRPLHAANELISPPAPRIFPPEIWHRQPKRIPHTHPKRRLSNAIELFIPQSPATAPTIFPPTARHGLVPKRIPRVKAKRVVKSSLELRIPQAPPAIFPPELRHRQTPKFIPRVKPKRPVRSSIELRIPQAPPAQAPLTILGRHVKKKGLTKIPRGRNHPPFLFARFKGTVTPPGQDAIVLWRKRRGY